MRLVQESIGVCTNTPTDLGSVKPGVSVSKLTDRPP